jgi:hypothetical protein
MAGQDYQPVRPIDNPLYADPQTDAPQGQSEPLPSDGGAQSVAEPSTVNSQETIATTEGTAAPLPDPTPASDTSSPVTVSDGSSLPSEAGQVSQSVDDVGYHNEPNMTGTTDWSEWDKWAARMTARYGVGQWPTRPSTATA